MTKNIHWARIVIAGFLVEVAIFAVFIPVFVLLGEQPGIYTAVQLNGKQPLQNF